MHSPPVRLLTDALSPCTSLDQYTCTPTKSDLSTWAHSTQPPVSRVGHITECIYGSLALLPNRPHEGLDNDTLCLKTTNLFGLTSRILVTACNAGRHRRSLPHTVHMNRVRVNVAFFDDYTPRQMPRSITSRLTTRQKIDSKRAYVILGT